MKKYQKAEQADGLERIHFFQYIRIANALREDPFASLSDLATSTALSRNTLSKCLTVMYTRTLLAGPLLTIRPHENNVVYLHLINVSDPFFIYQRVQSLPSVKNYAISTGNWNICMLTDGNLDVRELEGYNHTVYSGKRYTICSPPLISTSWRQYWQSTRKDLEQALSEKHTHREILPSLPWGEEEWQLYHAFKLNTRQCIPPILEEHGISYETFSAWKQSLLRHCTVLVRFYPRRREFYENICMVFRTHHAHLIKDFFSSIPTTPLFTDLEEHIMVQVRVPRKMARDIFSLMYEIEEKGIADDVNWATIMG